ncbi:hypothetical protein DPMN_055333, partial [Dreissena polymorpha]
SIPTEYKKSCKNMVLLASEEMVTLLWNAMHENALLNTGNEGGGDEEACSEPKRTHLHAHLGERKG